MEGDESNVILLRNLGSIREIYDMDGHGSLLELEGI